MNTYLPSLNKIKTKVIKMITRQGVTDFNISNLPKNPRSRRVNKVLLAHKKGVYKGYSI